MSTPTAPIDIPATGACFWDEIADQAVERIDNAGWVLAEVDELIETTLTELASSIDSTYRHDTDDTEMSD